MISSPKYVVDACALIAYMRSEKGADKMADLLEQAAVGHANLSMHAVNLGEVYYDCIRVDGAQRANEMLDAIDGLPLSIVWRIDKETVRTAGVLKAGHKLSYADCFAAALTIQQEACLVSTDRKEFGPLEKDGVLTVFWLR